MTLGVCMGGGGQTPRILRDTVNEREVRILLECILVGKKLRPWVLFVGHWCPCFGLLVTASLGFKVWIPSCTCASIGKARVRIVWQDRRSIEWAMSVRRLIFNDSFGCMLKQKYLRFVFNLFCRQQWMRQHKPTQLSCECHLYKHRRRLHLQVQARLLWRRIHVRQWVFEGSNF